MQLLGTAPLVLPSAGASAQAPRRSRRPFKAVLDRLQRWSGLALTGDSPPPNFGEIVFDQEARQLRGPAATSHLSPNELLLLLRLAQDRGRVLTHAVLLQDVWGPGYAEAHHLLHDTVSRLRHRFAVAGASVDPIETVHGVGYRLRPQRSGSKWGDIPFAL